MNAKHFPKILGTAHLNDKGQIVIPAEARHQLGLSSGSRIVVMSSPQHGGLVLFKAEDVEAVVRGLADALGPTADRAKRDNR